MGYLLGERTANAKQVALSIEWEETPCLLCGGRNRAPLLEAPAHAPPGAGLWFAVAQCQHCGLCFTNPRPSPASIGQFYPENYLPHREIGRETVKRRRGETATDSRRFAGSPIRRFATGLRRREKRQVLPWHGEGRLLDFGCGNGSFLIRMYRQGWKVTGIDASARAVQRLRRQLPSQVLLGSLPHPELEHEIFDVISMWQSLEHVHYPLEVLREAFRLLAPGGKLIVAVPNIDSLPFRWFGPAWYGLDLPRHLTHFTPTTLQLMLERAGFQVGPVRMVRHSHWLRASARLATSGWQRKLASKPLSRLVTWYSFLTHQADCIRVTAMT